MSVRQLLLSGHRRLVASGLLWWGFVWSVLSLAYFYWPSQRVLAPWLHRLAAMTSLEPALLRQPLLQASRDGLVGFLFGMFLLRLLLTPAVDAIIYGRLLQPRGQRFAFAAFYRLYLLEVLAVLLLGWLAYLAQNRLWSLLTQPTLLCAVAAVLGGLLFLVGFALAWQRTNLAGHVAGANWPPLRTTASVAVALGMLTLFFLLLLSVLSALAWRLSGVWLALSLVVLASARTYGRLWKLSCIVSAWRQE